MGEGIGIRVESTTGVVKNSGGSQQLAAADTARGAGMVKQFRLLDEAELRALPDPTWLVGGVIPEGGFIELHGPPGTYKSFLAVDLAMSIATGSEWAGCAVKQGPVVYVAAEGASGYKLRLPSWRSARGSDEEGQIYMLPEAVQLLDGSEVEAFLTAVREREPKPVLVVIDTLSRCFVGEDENSAKSMSLLVAAVDRVRRETGATVLLIHHTNKTGKAERGSIALRGAVDMLMSVTRTEDTVTLQCLKMKDGPEFTPMHFRFEEHGASGALVPLIESPANGLSDSDDELKGRDLVCYAALPERPIRHGEWVKLAEAAGVPRGSFPRHRKAVVKAGLAIKEADGRYRRAGEDTSNSIRSITPRRGDAVILTGASEPSGHPAEVAA